MLVHFPCIILYTKFDLKLWSKSHGPMHYKIGVTQIHVYSMYTR